MSRREDLFTAQNQRIIELEKEIKLKDMQIQYYREMIGEMMAEQAVDRAKQTGAWEG